MSLRTLLAFTLVFASLVSHAAAAGWKAGASREKITPETPMWMAGYGSRNHPATGHLNDLWAKALVLEDERGHRAAIITLDLVGIGPDTAEPILAALEKQYGLPRASVAICCSHTHSGPVLGKNLRSLHYDQIDAAQQKLVDAYAAAFIEKTIALVGRAVESLAPSELAYATGTATFAANRRANPEPEVPKRREAGELKGPFDHDVPVLKVTGAEGKLVAVLFGYACHATVLSDYDWSSDYPGFAQEAIEREHPGCTALFFAGCGADQNPLPRRQVPLAKKYGEELAAGVEAVLAGKMTPLTAKLDTTFTTVPLELASVPSREDVEQEAKSQDKYVSARAKYYLAELDAGRAIPKEYAYPVEVWRLGDELTFVALGGEVVVDYALRLKASHGAANTWVAGYANDVMAYIPSRRVLTEGGYEGGGAMVYYSLPSPWSPTVEEAIVKAVNGLMAEK